MDRAKAIKRINNLVKIKQIIEIAKFDTLQKLAEADKVKKYHYEIAEISKHVILYSKSHYHISNKLNKKKKHGEIKKLFIYLTIPSNLLNVSYDRLETILNNEFSKEHDKLITIGTPAETYSRRVRISPVVHFENLDTELHHMISIVTNMLNNNEVNQIYIVANTSHIKDSSYKLFPIDKEEGKNFDEIKNKKFFYSMGDVIEQISNTYLENIVEGIYKEAYREFYKEKLVRHEGSLTATDQKIKDLKMELHKIRRKKETEEMIQISQIVKRK